MSDFSFSPPGAKSASPFDRLKVKTPGIASGGASAPQGGKVFKEVGDAVSTRLSGLGEAVANAEVTKQSLAALSGQKSVSEVNLDSSKASVRDVEEAAKLATRIASGIAEDPKLFEAAQVAKIDGPAVQSLTSVDDGSVA